MIADCETCERKQVPCTSCQESQRAICFICQGDVADPYCEVTNPQFAADAVSDEDLIAEAPAALRQLAFKLTELLDEDHWKNIEPHLLDVARLLRGVSQTSHQAA